MLAAEMFATVYAIEFASTLRATVNDMFGRLVSLVLYTISKSLFDCIIGLNSTAEKRFLINLVRLRQIYEHRELNEVVCLPSIQSAADAMTKQNRSGALHTLFIDNKVNKSSKRSTEKSAFVKKKNIDGIRKA